MVTQLAAGTRGGRALGGLGLTFHPCPHWLSLVPASPELGTSHCHTRPGACSLTPGWALEPQARMETSETMRTVGLFSTRLFLPGDLVTVTYCQQRREAHGALQGR